jgi:hypothetical protein
MQERDPSEMMSRSRWWREEAGREEMESGVMVFDLRRREVVLGLVFVGALGVKEVREKVMYTHTYGEYSLWRDGLMES